MSNTKKRTAEQAAEPTLRSKKRRKKNKRHAAEDDLIDSAAGVNTAIAMMDSQLLADHLAQRTSRFGADLSPIELSDLALPGKTSCPFRNISCQCFAVGKTQLDKVGSMGHRAPGFGSL